MRYWGDIELPDEDELGERGDLPDVRPNNTSPSQTSEADDEE